MGTYDKVRHRGKSSKSKGSRNDTPQRSRRNSVGEKAEQEEERGTFRRDVHVATVVSAILLVVYTATLHPSLPGGDSGELIVSAHQLGVAHPPGYPVFTMLSKAFITLLPLGTPAFKVNLMNAIFSSMAGGCLLLVVLRITGCIGSSLLALGLFSLNKLTWTWSISAEVFGLNNLLTAVILLVAVIFESSDDPKHNVKCACLGSFLCGLSLCNQHTIVIYVGCLAIWVLLRLYNQKLMRFGVLVKVGLCFALGLTPYLYLPLSAHLGKARWTWGDQRTIDGFLTHFLRREYGTFDLGKNSSGGGLWLGLAAYWDHTHADMCELGPLLALIGVVVAIAWKLRGEGNAALVFFTMFLGYILFFSWRANLDISDPLMKGVVERFWMQADLVVAVLAGIGFNTAVRMCTEIFMGDQRASMASVFTVMGGSIVLALQLRNALECNQSNNYVVHDFGKLMLENMPKNAIVFTKGDLPSNAMRYFHLCEGVRPDVQLFDIEILSYEWSLPMLREHYTKINFPGDFWYSTNTEWSDGRRSFDFKSLLDANYQVPLLACIGIQDKDTSWQEGYQLWPYGPCKRIVRNTEPFNPAHWANTTGAFGDAWSHDFEGFPDTSWEKVANDEMWHAKIGSAFFMYQQSELAQDVEAKSQLIIRSYELYFRAIKVNQKPGKMTNIDGFPPFWHKNFALVCEKMLHIEHKINKNKLCKLSMYHFQQFLQHSPNDKDAESIQHAIGVLQQRLNTYEKFDAVDKTLDNMIDRQEKLEKKKQEEIDLSKDGTT